MYHKERLRSLLTTDTATSQVEPAKELIRLPTDAVVSQRKASMGQSWLVKSGLLTTDTATSQVELAKELIRLVKLGFLPTDAVVSQ